MGRTCTTWYTDPVQHRITAGQDLDDLDDLDDVDDVDDLDDLDDLDRDLVKVSTIVQRQLSENNLSRGESARTAGDELCR